MATNYKRVGKALKCYTKVLEDDFIDPKDRAGVIGDLFFNLPKGMIGKTVEITIRPVGKADKKHRLSEGLESF